MQVNFIRRFFSPEYFVKKDEIEEMVDPILSDEPVIVTEELKGKKRIKGIVVPRQIAMYLSRELTDSSLPKIGTEFGGKDHTTVLHAYDKISNSLAKDVTMKQEIDTIKETLKNM